MADTISINQNISLHYIPMQKLKTTAIGIYIHRPLTQEDATKNAILPSVLKRGCKKCPTSEAMAHTLENLYGASLGTGIMKKGEDQIIVFDGETISDRYAPDKEPLIAELVSVLLSCIFEPVTVDGAFSEEYVNQEKNNLKDRIQGIINDKRSYATMRCTQEMCKDDPFRISRLGCLEDVDALDAQQLYAYYQEIITASKMDIYICGDADVEKIAETIREYIRDMQFEETNIPKTTILKKNTDMVNQVDETMDVTQGKLSIGFRTNISPSDSEYWGLMVANNIFGGGAHSKLFNHVREKLSLAYYASSQLEKFKGLMMVNAGIEFQNFQAAYDEILSQLDSLKKGDISDLEFTSSIQAIMNVLDSYDDDPRYMQSFYVNEEVAGTQYDIEFVKEQVKKVTVNDVVAAVQKIRLDTVYFLKGKEA